MPTSIAGPVQHPQDITDNRSVGVLLSSSPDVGIFKIARSHTRATTLRHPRISHPGPGGQGVGWVGSRRMRIAR